MVLDHEGLSHWDSMLMAGNRYIETVVTYRTHQDAMRIVSCRLARPHIRFEAPSSCRVAVENGALHHKAQSIQARWPNAAQASPMSPSVSFSLKANIHSRTATAE